VRKNLPHFITCGQRVVQPALFFGSASAALARLFLRLFLFRLLRFLRGATGTRFRPASAAGGAYRARFSSAFALGATGTRFAGASSALGLLGIADPRQAAP
jgi:hypothetical protein